MYFIRCAILTTGIRACLDSFFGQHVLDTMASHKHLDKLRTDSEIKLPFSKEVALTQTPLGELQDLLNSASNIYDSYKTRTEYFVSYTDDKGVNQKVPITNLSKQDFINIVFSTSTLAVSLWNAESKDFTHVLSDYQPARLQQVSELFQICKSQGQFPETSVTTRADFDIRTSSFGEFLLYCVENRIDLDKIIYDASTLKTLFEEHKREHSRVLYRHIDKEGMLEELSMKEMSFESFKQLVLKHGLNNVVFQTKTDHYTLRRLSEFGVLENTRNGYELGENFEYTGLGFQSKHRLGAFSKRIQPIDKLKTHDGKYYLEVCSSVPKIGHIFDQGHASIKLISSQGHVFSLGVYPDETRRQVGDFDATAGKVNTKDAFTTYSPLKFNHKSTRLELPSEADFLRLKTFIENKIESPGEFQILNRNCARFARDVAVHAKSSCNAHVVRPFSLMNVAARVALAFRLYVYRCIFSYIQVGFTMDPRTFLNRVYLPQDMQLIT